MDSGSCWILIQNLLRSFEPVGHGIFGCSVSCDAPTRLETGHYCSPTCDPEALIVGDCTTGGLTSSCVADGPGTGAIAGRGAKNWCAAS